MTDAVPVPPLPARVIASAIEVALDSIITIDHRGLVLEFNPAAERTFGYRRADILGKPMNEFIVPPALREAHIRGMERYLAGGEPRVLGRRIEIEAMRADGSVIPVELAITRVPDVSPPIFTAYLRDLTERRRLETARELLLQASELLHSSLGTDHTLRRLSEVVVPAFADWYAVDLVEGDVLRRVEMSHRDPAKVQAARDMLTAYPDPREESAVWRAIESGQAEWAADIPDDQLVAAARDERHLGLLRELGLHSYIVVPLRTHGETFGAITFVQAESGRRYDDRDRAVAEDLARRAANAIENSRLFRAVEHQRELLEQQTIELELQAAEAEEARDEAHRANQAKSEFLAAMSHELRTPLNAVLGYAQLLETGVRGPMMPSQMEDLRRITRSAQHLLGLINDILNFARIEAGRVEYRLRDVDLREVLDRLEEMITPQAASRGLSLHVQHECPEVHVCADAEKLLQVLLNILSNAVRFTEAGGRIVVHCAEAGDRVEIRIEDTGVGIGAEQLETIFEPFVQAGGDYTTLRQGTGLGLAISRDLAHGMGGDLRAESELGRGSVFTLSLPRADTDGCGG